MDICSHTTINLFKRLIRVKSGTMTPSPTTTPQERTGKNILYIKGERTGKNIYILRSEVRELDKQMKNIIVSGERTGRTNKKYHNQW